MESNSTTKWLYCTIREDTYPWDEYQMCLPSRCVFCQHSLCRMAMMDRVHQNVDVLQLKFDFGEAV